MADGLTWASRNFPRLSSSPVRASIGGKDFQASVRGGAAPSRQLMFNDMWQR